MALSLVIRQYREEDREQCQGLWGELTEWHHKIYEDSSIGGEHLGVYFDKHLAKVGPEHLWVAVHDSKVVGLVGLELKGEETEIEPLVVSENYRHRDIVTRLIETILRETRKSGMKYLNVTPVARNIETIRFLYRRGFTNPTHINLFVDFSRHTWKPGPQIFGCRFNY